MSFSSAVKSRKGTFVRTPMARQTSVMRDHMRLFQGATAPSSMLIDSSGTRVAMSTVRTVPVPLQSGQAPWELKASSSADGAMKGTPHSGQTRSFSAATFKDGGT